MSEPEFEGHGWTVGGKTIHVGELPDRKRVCLYEVTDGGIRILAFFKTPEAARKALSWVDALAGLAS